MSESHRILIVGAGGREHALAWRLGREQDVEQVLVAPGNDGIGRDFPRVPLDGTDPDPLIAHCREARVTLVLIGPEGPLAAGLADRLEAAGILVFGPSAAAARLESSKWAAKELMASCGVPTARACRCTSRAEARETLATFAPPWVIKADGLASGKGVMVTDDLAEAGGFLDQCLERDRFGAAGRQVVIEEFLRGEEASIMAVCDGAHFFLLPPARDHKRAREGDRGPNTGGMGACAPAPGVDAALEADVGRTVLAPVLAAMAARGTPYRGLLYVGLMLTAEGPRVVEFNCRFGDPETQAVLPLVGGSLARLLSGAAAGRLDATAVTREPGAAVSVALVDAGYPERSAAGGTIEGLDALMAAGDVLVFHAGTAFEQGRWCVRGGRALHLAARGDSVAGARARVYAAVDRLGGSGWRCRGDIASAPGSGPVAGGVAGRAGAGAGAAACG